jgi:hypothetical protein
MKALTRLLVLLALVTGCAAQVDDSPTDATAPTPAAPASACAVFGEAPFVTTIRQPPSQPAPHPDCVEADGLSASGQRQYCCMGAAFDAWYARL